MVASRAGDHRRLAARLTVCSIEAEIELAETVDGEWKVRPFAEPTAEQRRALAAWLGEEPAEAASSE